MMTVDELIKNLQNFRMVNLDGGKAEIMLKYDSDICLEFGRADKAGGEPGHEYLIFCPNEKGKRIGIRDVGIKH